MRRFVSASLLFLLAAVQAPSTAVARDGACDTVMLRNLRVKVDVERNVYRIGDEATVILDVTRQPTNQPVDDALAAIGLPGKRDKLVYAVGKTNERGRARITLELRRRWVSPGPVTLHAYAYIRQVDTYCATVSEYGYKKARRAFRITR